MATPTKVVCSFGAKIFEISTCLETGDLLGTDQLMAWARAVVGHHGTKPEGKQFQTAVKSDILKAHRFISTCFNKRRQYAIGNVLRKVQKVSNTQSNKEIKSTFEISDF